MLLPFIFSSLFACSDGSDTPSAEPMDATGPDEVTLVLAYSANVQGELEPCG